MASDDDNESQKRDGAVESGPRDAAAGDADEQLASETDAAGDAVPSEDEGSQADADPEASDDSASAAEEPRAGDADRAAPPPHFPEDETPPGNAYNWARGLLTFLVGAAVPFLLMSMDRNWRYSVALGGVGCLVAAWGVLDLLGSFDDPGPADRVAGGTTLVALWPPFAEMVASGVVLCAVLTMAVSGVLPKQVLLAGLLVTASFLWLVVATFRTGQALGLWPDDVDGTKRDLLGRHGFWLIVIVTLLYLPMLGSFSLTDPWETHYGEVAREMLARDDWISLWWAQDGWFWSKPILDFWIQGLSFSLFGVGYMPDQMLASVAEGRFPQPEWAARMPVFLITLIATYVLYKALAVAFNRRAGFVAGLVLTTMPYWYFLSHQTMTDMPYVGPVTAAVGFLILGFVTDPQQQLRLYELRVGSRTLRFSGATLLWGVVALMVIPQVLYLLSQHLTLQLVGDPKGFRWNLTDEFWAGSGGGNCGLPGNAACVKHKPVNEVFQPGIGALMWLVVAGVAFVFQRGERRTQRIYFLAAWVCTAVAAMGKGAPGLVLPLAVALAYVGVTRRWRELARLELAAGVLLICCIALPWYVQMYMRHGQPFTDRLLFHDMWKRAFVHVHDTNAGDDVSFRYYVWQLGYGLFPWTGLAAGGLLWWGRFRDYASSSRSAAVVLVMWAVAAFGMFSITLTKFHHYILPIVPPIAALTGVMVDRALGDGPLARDRRRTGAYLVGVVAGTALILLGASACFPGALTGALVDGERAPARLGAGIGTMIAGLVLAVVAARVFGKPADALVQELSDSSDEHRVDVWESAAIGAIGVAAAIIVALAGRDMFVTIKGDVDGSARLVHLFTYNYRRPWPESLDFRGVFAAFTAVSAVLCFGLLVARWRRHVASMICSVALLWALWGVNVYLVKIAPHWGQRETIMAYYEKRADKDEWLVAYQMNWKGENFYTGNRIPAFVSTGAKFKKWVEEQKALGRKVMFFTTEHGRINGLKNELGRPEDFEKLTTPELNNKFFTGRARFDGAAAPEQK